MYMIVFISNLAYVPETKLQSAIDDIVNSNSRVDNEHVAEAAWHFNGEQIAKGTIRRLNKDKTTQKKYDFAKSFKLTFSSDFCIKFIVLKEVFITNLFLKSEFHLKED